MSHPWRHSCWPYDAIQRQRGIWYKSRRDDSYADPRYRPIVGLGEQYVCNCFKGAVKEEKLRNFGSRDERPFNLGPQGVQLQSNFLRRRLDED